MPQRCPHNRDDALDSAHKTLFDSGLSIRKAVAGPEYVEKALQTYSSPFSRLSVLGNTTVEKSTTLTTRTNATPPLMTGLGAAGGRIGTWQGR